MLSALILPIFNAFSFPVSAPWIYTLPALSTFNAPVTFISIALSAAPTSPLFAVNVTLSASIEGVVNAVSCFIPLEEFILTLSP